MREKLLTDLQGWLALAVFVQSSGLFILMALIPELLDSQGFMTLASAVIVTGWVGAVLAFAFQAGKAAGEQQATINRALDIAATAQASPGPPIAPLGDPPARQE